MCAKGTADDVCAMIEQRDYNADQAAAAEGGRRTEIRKRGAEHAYWRNYISGLPDIPTTEKHIKAVCATQHGQQSKHVTELCRWWESTQPKPYVKGSTK